MTAATSPGGDAALPADLEALASSLHAQVSSFLLVVGEIGSGDRPEYALSLLLLETSQLALAGGRLGALDDVVPSGSYEIDPGPDPDLDELRDGLRGLLGPVDAYLDVVDPVDPDRGTSAFRISDELAGVCADLLHGLAHYDAGRHREALWWWQYSYLASWGTSLVSVLRALLALVAHTRLDAEGRLAAAGSMS